MKIDALDLVAFGPFTGKVIDFSGAGYGLHVVFGANEAGKSTALRALQGLLYGFGHKVEDAWLHDYRKLAVGARLAISNGEPLHVMRYKRRKNDLIDEDTGRPLDQAQIDRLLGHMDREGFQHAFGISHDSLRQGVESVRNAGGDLRQALFAATSGMSTLKAVMDELEEQQSRLFSPRAQKARINARVAALDDLRKRQREASAGHRQWKKMRKEVESLRQQEADTAGEIEKLSCEINLLSRHHAALKYVGQKERLEMELAELGVLPDLPEDFSQRRVETQVAMSRSREIERQLVKELQEIDDKLKGLTYDERLIANEKRITELAEDAHVHAKASSDSKKLRGEIYRHQESAQQKLEALRPSLDLTSVEALRLSRLEKGKIQRLGAAGAKLEAAVDGTRKTIRAAEQNFEKAKRTLDQMETPEDTSNLEDCLARAVEHGKLEDRLAEGEGDVERLERQVRADLSALGLWRGDIWELERLALPNEETMRVFERDFAHIDQIHMDVQKEIERTEGLIERNEKILAELSKAGELPSPFDLKRQRDVRDNGWQSVRSVWLEGGEPDAEFLKNFPESDNLAEAYEKSVAQADSTADMLREEAETVARGETLKGDIREQKKNHVEMKARHEALKGERVALQEKWSALWQPLGIVPLTPREMMVWSNRAQELRQKVADLRERRIAVERMRSDMEQMKTNIGSALERIKVPIPEEIDYAGMIALAKRTVLHNEEVRGRRRDLEKRMTALEEEMRTAAERRGDAEEALDTWRRDWTSAISPLGFSGHAVPEEINDFILALDEIHGELEKAKEKQQRVSGMQHNRNVYSERVSSAVSELAPDLNQLEPEAAALELHARMVQDKEKRQTYIMLEEEKRRKQSALSKEREKLAGYTESLRLLCGDAHAESAEELPSIEKRVEARSRVLDTLYHLDERLAELASGEDLQEFVSRVKSYDPDELIARRDRLEGKKQGALEQQKELVRNIALAEKELDAIGGESLAAGIAEEAEGLVAELESDVEHYVKLKLASVVLNRAMERYRESHQSPVLSAAGGYFERMTGGAFQGLRADFDDKGDPVIKGIRPDGMLLSVEEMSDGSRDQLFLSLRLGGLVTFVRNNGPMPFIVDDVLVHFDDQRAAAALAAMGELAEKTQIIFFTHHQHLLDLAQKSLSEDSLHIHRL